ncbi:MAG TPA: tRNA epoxyqueuosine(34) reductase QueG [Acidobacteriaceae bacterium]|nr:tRNA epoxyqueuosine(34) reductase QueG [Acidobacteriaceae bacterium]
MTASIPSTGLAPHGEEISIATKGEWTPELEQWLRERAAEAGFDTAGVASVNATDSAPPDSGNDTAQLDAQRFAAWVAAGRAGEMEYLKRRDEQGVLLRSGVQVAMPWARSVIVCALNYNASGPLSIESAASGAGWIARYAWSGRAADAATNATADELVPTDYHDQLLGRLRQVEAAIRERFPCETRCYVDTGPLVERTMAAKAGVGWIGKNTCVINQGLGSWLLLGVVVTSIPVAAEAKFEGAKFQIAADRCGSCTRCIDACPTDALVAPYQMDASRCIAYLTIEKKGVIAEELREPMGRQVFGCDICQDVCPWNRRAPISAREGMLARKQMVNPALEWLAAMDAAEFKRWFKGSPVERTRRKRLLRNVAIAMGNSGEPRFLAQLKTWTAAEDSVLAEAAKWATNRIRRVEIQHNQAATAGREDSEAG